MATVAFPPNVGVERFSWRVDAPGRRVIESPYGPSDFVVGAGWTRLAGTVTLAPGSDADDHELAAFLGALDGDDNDVLMPLGGALFVGAAFSETTATVANTVRDASRATSALALASPVTVNERRLSTSRPAGYLPFASGAGIVLVDGVPRALTGAVMSSGAVATRSIETSRSPAKSGAKVEFAIKVRMLAGSVLVDDGPGPGLDPITLPWRQLPA